MEDGGALVISRRHGPGVLQGVDRPLDFLPARVEGVSEPFTGAGLRRRRPTSRRARRPPGGPRRRAGRAGRRWSPRSPSTGRCGLPSRRRPGQPRRLCRAWEARTKPRPGDADDGHLVRAVSPAPVRMRCPQHHRPGVRQDSAPVRRTRAPTCAFASVADCGRVGPALSRPGASRGSECSIPFMNTEVVLTRTCAVHNIETSEAKFGLISSASTSPDPPVNAYRPDPAHRSFCSISSIRSSRPAACAPGGAR